MSLRFRGLVLSGRILNGLWEDSEESPRYVSVYVSVAPVELRKPVLQKQLEMEPTVRIELTTRALRKRCSTD